MTTITPGHSAEAFIADLRHWREVRGLSQKRLAAEMGYDASYISKIESGHQKPTRDFAARADDVSTPRVCSFDAGASTRQPPARTVARMPGENCQRCRFR